MKAYVYDIIPRVAAPPAKRIDYFILNPRPDMTLEYSLKSLFLR